MKKSANISVATAFILVASTGPAFAYIDPGTGSMILQGIIGGVAGGLFIMRTYWAKVVAFFSGSRKAAGVDAADDVASTDA